MRTATATPVKTIRGRICIIWIALTRVLGSRLNTIHNLRFYQKVMSDMRDALDAGTFDDYVKEFYRLRDQSVPALD
jgi:tRNA-guanine transglycosylase (EC 2.4.2.29)